jgi:hypothetical protein
MFRFVYSYSGLLFNASFAPDDTYPLFVTTWVAGFSSCRLVSPLLTLSSIASLIISLIVSSSSTIELPVVSGAKCVCSSIASLSALTIFSAINLEGSSSSISLILAFHINHACLSSSNSK